MAGYCGICNTHYDCHFSEHDLDCPGTTSRPIEVGSQEDFERQVRDNNWDNETAEQIWNEHFK